VYDTPFYRRLRGWIGWCVDHRGRVLGVTLALFVLGLAGSRWSAAILPEFGPPELLIDLRLPEGASLAATLREAQRFESTLGKRPEIDHYIDFVARARRASTCRWINNSRRRTLHSSS